MRDPHRLSVSLSSCVSFVLLSCSAPCIVCLAPARTLIIHLSPCICSFVTLTRIVHHRYHCYSYVHSFPPHVLHASYISLFGYNPTHFFIRYTTFLCLFPFSSQNPCSFHSHHNTVSFISICIIVICHMLSLLCNINPYSRIRIIYITVEVQLVDTLSYASLSIIFIPHCIIVFPPHRFCSWSRWISIFIISSDFVAKIDPLSSLMQPK